MGILPSLHPLFVVTQQGACIIKNEWLGWTANPPINSKHVSPAVTMAVATMAAAFRRRPHPHLPVVVYIVVLVHVILVNLGISVAIGIFALLSSSLAALGHPFVLLFAPAGYCVLPLLSYRLGLPSCPLVALAGCCVLHASATLSGWVALPSFTLIVPVSCSV